MSCRIIVEAVDEKMVVFDPKKEEEDFFFHGSKQKGRDMLKKQNKNTQYLFDRVFGPESSNEDVFEGSTKNIVTSVLDGYNCSGKFLVTLCSLCSFCNFCQIIICCFSICLWSNRCREDFYDAGYQRQSRYYPPYNG